MGTLSDYIKWRGDLEFWQDGFNVIDSMVLSCLSTTEDVSKTARLFEKKLKENIYKMSDEELNEFVDDFFSIFESTGAVTISEMKKSGIRGLKAMTKTAGNITKKIISDKI